MANVNVGLDDYTPAPTVQMLATESGPFLVLAFGDSLTLMLPGFGSACAAYARELADALIKAADQIPGPTVIESPPAEPAALEPSVAITDRDIPL